VLERIVKLLSKEIGITVFSLFKVNETYKPEGFELITIAERNPFLKTVSLLRVFCYQHRRKHFSIVHGFWTLPCGFLAVVCGKIFNIRSIVSVLGGDGASVPEINYGELRKTFSRRLILWSLQNSGEVIVLTKFLSDNLRRVGLKRAMKIIPWGIDTKLFSFNEKSLDRPIKFLHVANLSAVKDQETLIKTFKIIASHVDARLQIVGTGSDREKVIRMIVENDLSSKITIHDPVPYEQLKIYYDNSDTLLHTSLSEGQSEVVTEAMSAGLLVCGTRVGLLYDVPEACVSVNVRDYKSLAEAIINIFENKELIASKRNAAREWTEKHSIEWTVQKILETYE
jgi:glycosyltransferase involved in cell wall biosynthesis